MNVLTCPLCVVYSFQQFVFPAKAVFTSPPCKHAPDSKSLPVWWCFNCTKCVRVRSKIFFSKKIYKNVRIINRFICKLLKCKSRFHAVRFLIIYIYFSSVLTSFCWLTNCVHHHIYKRKTVKVQQRNKKKKKKKRKKKRKEETSFDVLCKNRSS